MDVQVSKTAGPEELSAPVRDEVKKVLRPGCIATLHAKRACRVEPVSLCESLRFVEEFPPLPTGRNLKSRIDNSSGSPLS
jgi:hypothetical protein